MREGKGPLHTTEEEHREVDLLLPWYVNGTLSVEEAERVERYLLLCPFCQKEMEGLRGIQSAVIRSGAEIPEPSPHAIDQVLHRIAAEERLREVERQVRREAFWDRVRSYFVAPLSGLRPVPVLALLVIVLQFGAIAWLVGRDSLDREYRTLSLPEVQVSPRPRVVIIFQEEAPQKAIQELILSLQGSIVKGPTPQGAYVVEIGKPLASPEELEKLVQEIRAKRSLVKFVGRAGRGGSYAKVHPLSDPSPHRSGLWRRREQGADLRASRGATSEGGTVSSTCARDAEAASHHQGAYAAHQAAHTPNPSFG